MSDARGVTVADVRPGLEVARDRAEAACQSWQFVFESIEAHLLDRIAMGDAANPQTYLDIIRADVANIHRESKQICASRWHEAAQQQNTISQLEAALALAAPVSPDGGMSDEDWKMFREAASRLASSDNFYDRLHAEKCLRTIAARQDRDRGEV